MMRGIGRQLLFENNDERNAFLDIVRRYRDAMNISVIAWCLMDNHIHLLLKDNEGNLSKAMQRIAVTFAQFHNKNADHVGHVFENRFKSKPIESDAQLLACLRYIHDNPAKAGICAADVYPWSSFREYVCGGELTDTDLVLDMLGGREAFLDFSHAAASAYDEPGKPMRMADEDAHTAMRTVLGEAGMYDLEYGSKEKRDAALRMLKGAGLTVRQIERLTGIGRSTIQRA